MSNNHNCQSNYKHIESLVRDLHTAKNIPQPDQLHSPNVNNPRKPLLMTSNPCRSIISNAHRKLMVHQLSPVHPPPPLCMIIDEEEYVESTNDTIKTKTTNSLDISLRLLPGDSGNRTKTSKGIGNEVNCTTIPSVMVNDVNEPLDLISTTHRRFSQLYSGLRRLSTSSTVGL